MANKKTDPFAEDTAPEVEGTTTDLVVEQGDLEVSVTLKGGRDFDAPWVVVRAQSTAAALAALDEQMQDLLKATAKYGKAFAQLGSENKPASKGARPAPGPQEHPGGREEFCSHGKRVYKTGVAKSGKNAGKTWEAFDCPEGECQRSWVND